MHIGFVAIFVHFIDVLSETAPNNQQLYCVVSAHIKWRKYELNHKYKITHIFFLLPYTTLTIIWLCH